MNSFFTNDELLNIGFQHVGENVSISRKASFYSPEKITIGNNVRIDDFCILSGSIVLNNFIHLSAYSACFAGDIGIEIESFCCLSSRVSVYAISDDYSGIAMTNPTIPIKYRKVDQKKVIIKKHSLIGAGSIVLPGVIIQEGSSFGAMSLILQDSEPWSINVGIPAKKIKNREKNILTLEEKLLEEISNEK